MIIFLDKAGDKYRPINETHLYNDFKIGHTESYNHKQFFYGESMGEDKRINPATNKISPFIFHDPSTYDDVLFSTKIYVSWMYL